MSQPFVGELRMVGFNFAPANWSTCAGQIVSISDNDALYTLIGTTYGGDGVTTFGLPNLQSRVAVHQGTGAGQTYVPGLVGGSENATILSSNYPAHSHSLLESTNSQGLLSDPAGNAVGSSTNLYSAALPPSVSMLGSMVSTAPGGSLPHSNIQPFLALNWIIALYGVFPSQN